MSLPSYKREHVRAPLTTELLYGDEGYVFKARLLNISEGGLLLENLPHFPATNVVPLMIELPQYPTFSLSSEAELKGVKFSDLRGDIIRTKVKIVRQVEGMSAVDKIFVNRIGCQFLEISEMSKRKISLYVENYAKNVVYLLKILEGGNVKGEKLALLRNLSHLLGYMKDLPLSELHHNIKHDYVSLENA